MKIARYLILSAVSVGISLSITQAASVESVESVMAKPALQKVDAFLSERVVADQLIKLGVTPAQIQTRLAKLDDAQLAQLAVQVDKVQAGGSIEYGHPHPLGPIGCVIRQIGITITHIFKMVFCWTDIP